MKCLHFLLLFIFLSIQSYSQIEVIDDGSIEIINELDWYESFQVQLSNTADTAVIFDWRLNLPEELHDHLKIFLHDQNIGWISDIFSSCGYDQPNYLDGLSDDTFYFEFIVREVIPYELLHLVDSITFELLTYPDCDAILHSFNLVNTILSSSIEHTIKQASVFPNPTKEILYFKNLPNERIEYEMYNQIGMEVKHGFTSNNQIELDFMKSGIYILKLYDQEKDFYLRFVKSDGQ